MNGDIPFQKNAGDGGVLSRLLIIVLLIAIAWFLGSKLAHLVRLLLVSSLLAFLLDPAVRWVEGNSRLGRLWSTVIVFVVTLSTISLAMVVLVPVIFQQAQAFQAGPSIEFALEQIAAFDTMLSDKLARYQVQEIQLAGAIRERIIGGVLVGILPNALQLAADTALVPFMLFFMLKDWALFKKSAIRLVPNRYFEFTGAVLSRVSDQIGNYLRGQAVAAIVVAALVILALSILDVEYAVTIGVVAGIANVVPYIGPLTGVALATLVSFASTGSIVGLLPIVVAFAIIQAIDNTLVQPLVVGRAVRIHPLLVVIGVIAGGTLFGFWGLLLAVPTVAAVKVLLHEATKDVKKFDFAA